MNYHVIGIKKCDSRTLVQAHIEASEPYSKYLKTMT